VHADADGHADAGRYADASGHTDADRHADADGHADSGRHTDALGMLTGILLLKPLGLLKDRLMYMLIDMLTILMPTTVNWSYKPLYLSEHIRNHDPRHCNHPALALMLSLLSLYCLSYPAVDYSVLFLQSLTKY
jgi:hypothetical protein